MPTYPYQDGEHRWEVVKPMSAIDTPEACPKCGKAGERYIARTHFYGASDWNRLEYNRGLGTWTRGFKHASQIAKERGLDEVGSTSPETLHKMYDEQRETTRRQSWDKTAHEALTDVHNLGELKGA